MRAVEGRRHYVYRCYDADGALVYIGATSDLRARMREYEQRRDVVIWDSVEYPTRAEAFAAERAAIAAERPRMNIQGKASAA